MPGCVTAAGRAACACKSQLASLLACQMPLKLGLPPTVAGRAAGAWPDVPVMDTEITALTAAAAMATDIIEPEKWRRMMVSSCLRLTLLQRIVFNAHEIGGVVFCRRVRTSPFRIGELLGAPSPQQPRKAIVPFDAARLVIGSVFLVALPGELLLDGPRSRPHRRIFDRHGIFERGRAGPCPALNQMQVLARALIIRLRTEVCHVDHKRIALPMAARIAIPLADARGQVGASIHDNVALPALALAHVVEHRDAAGCLHDAAEAAGRRAKFGQPERQAAVRQRAVLRTVMAIDAYRIVTRRRVRESR